MSAAAWSLGTIEQERKRLVAIVNYFVTEEGVAEEAVRMINSLAGQAAQRWEAPVRQETGGK